MMRVARNYCVTAFFEATDELSEEEIALYYAENLEELFSDPLFRYVIVNVEVCPTTEKVHWQMYMELSRPCSFVAVKKIVPLLEKAEFAPRYGTQMEAISYCQKTETRFPGVAGFFEYGVKCPGQGHRSDMDSLTAMLESGKSAREIAVEMPGMFLRYHRGIEAYQDVMGDVVQPEEGFEPRPWQAELLAKIGEVADDRTILWFTDQQGGRGKTRLATHLVRNYGAVQLSGRVQDMAFAFSQCVSPVVVFDITRAAQENTAHLYTMMEMLKSGRLFSTKYKSRQVHFPPPHVVVFSNQTWDRSMLSRDRVVEQVL